MVVFMVESEMVISVDDARESIATINNLAIFAANHNVHTEEVKQLVSVVNILKKVLSSNTPHEVKPCSST